VKRGDLYRVCRGAKYDPKDYRAFLVVSRQPLIDSRFSTVICAPIYSGYIGSLSPSKLEAVNAALRIALAVE
jgi:mRNA interferase MazF